VSSTTRGKCQGGTLRQYNVVPLLVIHYSFLTHMSLHIYTLAIEVLQVRKERIARALCVEALSCRCNLGRLAVRPRVSLGRSIAVCPRVLLGRCLAVRPRVSLVSCINNL